MPRRSRLLALFLIFASVITVPASVFANQGNFRATTGPEIRVVPGSTINLVSRESNIPITVVNESAVETTVTLHTRVSNLRIEVPRETLVTIPAGTSVNAELPVVAVANGEVGLTVWLVDSTGQKLGGNYEFVVNVNYDLEAVITTSFFGLILVLVLIGVIRMVRRRRA